MVPSRELSDVRISDYVEIRVKGDETSKCVHTCIGAKDKESHSKVLVDMRYGLGMVTLENKPVGRLDYILKRRVTELLCKYSGPKVRCGTGVI